MIKHIQGSLDGIGLRIGVVVSRFNNEITEKLEAGALRALTEAQVAAEEIRVVRVPGAVEIPLAVKCLFEMGFDGVVAVGAVIRGETTHYESVCNSVEQGCTRLQIDYMKPIGFGVVTTENDEQALARAGGEHGNKGYEAAQVTLEMVNLLRSIR